MDLPPAIARLEATILAACGGEDEWPAQVAAGIYAGVDYAIAHPEVEPLVSGAGNGVERLRSYEPLIAHLAGLLQAEAPLQNRLCPPTDEALVAGIVGLVGDHLRSGRSDRLEELRPEIVLLALLPYLGFVEAQKWADRGGNRASS
jgi:hypothetical protein